VSSTSRVRHFKMARRQDDRAHVDEIEVSGTRMRHQGGMDRVEHMIAEKDGLPTATFFSGCSDDLHRYADIAGDFGQSQSGSHACCTDHVVTAGMPDAGQRVVLRAEPQDEVAATGCCHKCGSESADIAFDLGGVVFE
jgi:hypothetical protein